MNIKMLRIKLIKTKIHYKKKKIEKNWIKKLMKNFQILFVVFQSRIIC